MIIKRFTIKNFGKIHDKTMELSPGMNVLYGENESGKTTVHTFLKSMFYGVQRQRGRAAKTDVYNRYEPWENPAVYGGTLWFENGGKNFRLTRNFYKNDQSSEFLCEDDGELLDVEQGDLEAVLGGVSEVIYDNTVSVAQLKSVTGQDLVRELQNYMASYQGTGDSSVDVGRAVQMLKMSRKGFQVQAQKQQKENEKIQEKIAVSMDYIRNEMEKLKDQKEEISTREASLHMTDEEDGEAILDERIVKIEKNRMSFYMTMLATVIVAFAGIFVLAKVIPGTMIPRVVVGILAVLAFIWEYAQVRNLSDELERRKKMKSRWIQKQEKLRWNRENLEETWKEKEKELENLQTDYQETQENTYHPLAEETEIEALNLAMETIEKLSGNIHNRVGDRLRQRTSEILCEITGGKYREVLMDAGLHMMVNIEDRTVPLASLSRGTLEQIYFALRMAAGELLCGQECFPVILDDVFGMYDEERLASALRWLHKEQRQVIISTCHKREMEILEKEGIPFCKLVL